MSANTPNIGLVTNTSGTEHPLRTDFKGNFEKIDTAIGPLAQLPTTEKLQLALSIKEIYDALKATADGTSGSDFIGATPVLTGGGNSIQSNMKAIYASIVSSTLGQIPNDSLTEAKMASEMKKDIAGGVASYNSFNAHLADYAKIIINVMAAPYNAKGDGITDDTQAIQNAINDAQLVNGIVVFPLANYAVSSSLLITNGVTLRGLGNGVGPTGSGQISRNYASNIEATSAFAGGDIISVITPKSVIVENLLFSFKDTWTISPNNRRTSGSAISIQGTNPAILYGVNNASVVRNCAFIGQYNCISEMHCVWNRVYDNFFYLWANDAIYTTSLVTNEETIGGWIERNFFFGDTDSTTTQNSCIHFQNGYTWIHDNYMVGAKKGIIGNIRLSSAGYISIKNNSIEQQINFGIWLLNGNDITASMVQIIGNQFSHQNYPTIFSTHLYIQQGTTRWIDKIMIKDNVSNSTLETASAHFSIQDGKDIEITGNMLDNHGHATSQPILIGASVTGKCLVDNNRFIGFLANPTYSSVCIVLDKFTSYTIASMPTNADNGSEFFVSDGKKTDATNSILASGGTGTYAKKMNGAWYALI